MEQQATPEVAHKNSHLWMIATVVVVLVAAVGVYVYLAKMRAVTPQPTELTGAPATQAQTISDELKQLDLAEIKASISEIQSILAAL